MGFGTDLSTEFHRLTKGVFLPEEDLFCKLQDAFLVLKHHYPKYRYAIDIIHGKKSLVDFSYTGSTVSSIPRGATKTKEMADMMFVVLGKNSREIRLTYLQNKKGASSTKFRADLLQLYLLKDRPHITSRPLPSCAFRDPDILRNAPLPSVGSYGVFYKHGTDVEMSYFPAGNIAPLRKTGKSITRSVRSDRANIGKIITISGFQESQGAATVHDFGESLIAMTIGTPFPNMDSNRAFSDIFAFLARKSPIVAGWPQAQQSISRSNMTDEQDGWLRGPAAAVVINSDLIRGAN